MFWNFLRILCGNSRFLNLDDVEFPIFIQIYMLEIQAAGKDAEALYVILGAGKDAEALCVILAMGGVGTEIPKLRTVRRTRTFS